MAGLVGSIFGKTVQELQQERIAQRKQQMAQAIAEAEKRKGSGGAAALGFSLGEKFGRKLFGDPEMEEAREAEAQQEALNKQLGSFDRPDDPLRFMVMADAAKSVGNMDAYIDYLGMAANAENIAERRREQYRVQQEKEADELSEQLDLRDKGIALSTIFDKNTSKEDRNKAVQDFYQLGGNANDLYAYTQIGESLSKGNQGRTKRQTDLTDKFVSDITNGIASPAEVYQNYKSIYGDDFVVPESFLNRFDTNEGNSGDGNKTVSGKGLNLTSDTSNKNNKTPSVSKQNEANLGTLYDVLGLPTEEEVKRAGTQAFRPWEL
jgi:hypothetical protein